MAGVNATNVGLMYVHILDGVTETLNNTSKARNKVTQNYEWKGSHLEHKLHVARNGAIKFMQDGTAFPVPDKQDYVSLKVGRKLIGASIQLSDVVMATAAKAPEVAMDVVTSETDGMMKDILKLESFFFWRDGTGQVATVTTNALATATTLFVDDARMLWDKGYYDVYRAGVLIARIRVTSVAPTPSLAAGEYRMQVTTAALPAAINDGDTIHWVDAYNGTTGIAYTGMQTLVNDSLTGTFQSVTMASYPRWTSLIMDASGVKRDLTPALFRQFQAGVYHKTGTDLPVKGLSCTGTAYQLAQMDELYEASLRLTSGDGEGGVSTPTFKSSLGKITVEADCDAPYGQLGLYDYSQVTRGVQKKLGWRTENGAIFKRSDVAPEWTATAIEIAEMYIKGRNSSGRIEDLNEVITSAY